MEKLSRNLPSQFPAFRLMVARQMEGHRERIATRIRREAAKRGESAPDLAHALGVYPSTAERWAGPPADDQLSALVAGGGPLGAPPLDGRRLMQTNTEAGVRPTEG